MGLLQNAAVAVGFGATELDIVLEHAEHFRGGPVFGHLQVRGGEIAQLATSIEIYTFEKWSETRSRMGKTDIITKTKSHGNMTLAADFSIGAGAAFQWPFKIPIPRGANLSHNWSIQATMSVASAVDRHASFALRPYDSAATLGLKQALCQIAPFTLRGVGAQHFDLVPPADLAAVLDGVKFIGDATKTGHFLVGELEINPQEKGVVDHLKSLVRADRVSLPVEFPRAKLQPNQPPTPEVMTHLQDLLAPYLNDASTPINWKVHSSGLFETKI